MTAERFDVVVVGAGPAGSTAAKTAARKGARVLLLERDRSIGTPVRCGEGFSQKTLVRYLDKIDPRWISAHVTSARLHAPNGDSVVINQPDELGIVVDRCIFDRHLAEMAAEAGALVQTRSDVEGLVIEKDQVKGVYYTYLGQRHEVRCGVVIGADGVESRVGRWAGLPTQVSPSEMESAYQMVLSGIDYEHENAHFFFGNDLAPGGYIWIFPKGPHTANVGIGVKVNLCSPGDARRNLDVFISKRFGRPSVVSESAGAVPCDKPLKQPFTDGLLLAGDAGHFCNPLTGGGISSGIMTGHHAGETAAEAAGSGQVGRDFLKVYLKRIEKDVLDPHRTYYRLSKAVSRLSDDTLNRTAREINAIPMEGRTLRTILLKGLIGSPHLALDIMKAFL